MVVQNGELNWQFTQEIFGSLGIFTMQPYYNDRRFLIFFDKEKQDVRALQTEELSAPIKDSKTSEDLKQKLTLKVNAAQTIDLMLHPLPSEVRFNTIPMVTMSLSQDAYERMVKFGNILLPIPNGEVHFKPYEE